MSIKSIVKWPAIFLAVIAVLYSIIPFVAGPVASYFLKGTGVKLVTLDLGYPAWKKIVIHHVVVDVSGVGRFEFNEGLFECDGLVLVFQSGNHRKTDYVFSSLEESDGFVVLNFLPNKIIPRLPLFDVGLERFSSDQYPGVLTKTRVKHTSDGVFFFSLFNGELNGSETFLVFKTSVEQNNAVTFEAESPGDGRVFSVLGEFRELDDALRGVEFDVRANIYPHMLDAIAPDGFERVRAGLDMNVDLPIRIVSVSDLLASDVRGLAFLALYDDSESNMETVVNLTFGESDADIVDGENDSVGKDESANKNNKQAITRAFGRLSGSVTVNRREALDFVVSDLNVDAAGQSLSFRVDSTMHHEVLKLFQQGFDIVGTSTSSSFEAKVDSEMIRLELIDVSPIGFQVEKLEDLGVSGLSIEVPKQSLSYGFEKQELSAFRFEYAALYAKNGNGGDGKGLREKTGNKEKGSKISGSVVLSLKDGAASVNVNSDRTTVLGLELPEYQARASVQYGDNLSASFALLNACEQEIASGTWSSMVGEISVSSQKQFSTESSLHHWLNISDLPVNFESGSFSFDAVLLIGGGGIVNEEPSAHNMPSSNKELPANKELSVNKKTLGDKTELSVNLVLNEGLMVTSFGNFENVQFSFSSLPSESKRNQVFAFEGSIASANVGVPLGNLLMNGSVTQSSSGWTVDLSEARATMFDGKVELKQFPSTHGKGIRYALEFENIDLDKVVKTQDVKGLSTTGSISGGFPFTIDAGVFQMGLGKVQNYDGGIIRYLSSMTESADLHEQFKYTLKVLENFNYDLLDTVVSVEGENVMLKSKIVGRNPKFDNAQAIELNLNTELEWRPVLKYMRLQSGLKAAVEDFVKAGVNRQSDLNVCRLGGL